ncbi:Hsp20 family protein [[Brevibacterium] frigoritolerans]|uniref:Hsp20 family protein n=1 Tax=Peribacillus frigoritolerans TaxID=450367 RepID=A0A941FKF7_9BACI|nr:Hsp20 family protein [Peribacillus frigoritolerans]
MLKSLDDFFGSAKERSFPVDIHETHSEYTLTATLPGIPRSQISIDVLAHSVTISAKHGDRKDKNQGLFHKEVSAGTFQEPFPFQNRLMKQM